MTNDIFVIDLEPWVDAQLWNPAKVQECVVILKLREEFGPKDCSNWSSQTIKRLFHIKQSSVLFDNELKSLLVITRHAQAANTIIENAECLPGHCIYKYKDEMDAQRLCAWLEKRSDSELDDMGADGRPTGSEDSADEESETPDGPATTPDNLETPSPPEVLLEERIQPESGSKSQEQGIAIISNALEDGCPAVPSASSASKTPPRSGTMNRGYASQNMAMFTIIMLACDYRRSLRKSTLISSMVRTYLSSKLDQHNPLLVVALGHVVDAAEEVDDEGRSVDGLAHILRSAFIHHRACFGYPE